MIAVDYTEFRLDAFEVPNTSVSLHKPLKVIFSFAIQATKRINRIEIKDHCAPSKQKQD